MDASGAVYQVIVGGIGRRNISFDDRERTDFVKRLDDLVLGTQMALSRAFFGICGSTGWKNWVSTFDTWHFVGSVN
jgi:hypothetical protein